MSENVDLVRSLYLALNDAYATGEYGAVDLALVHPDVVLRTSGMFPESGEYRGVEALREFTVNQTQAFESMFVEPLEYIEIGERVVVPLRFGGKARHTGIHAAFEVVHAWTFREGRVAELIIYGDLDEALKADDPAG